MPEKKISPIYPGEILLLEFLQPLGVSQYRLAKDIGVAPRRIHEIVKGKRAITANTAVRLAKFFGNSERFWLNLQVHYDLEREHDRSRKGLEAIRPLARAVGAKRRDRRGINTIPPVKSVQWNVRKHRQYRQVT